MRNISTAMKNWLAGSQLTPALCVLLTRTDGVSFGFTTFDRNLTVSGQLYEASNAFTASSSKQASGTTVDNLSINGILRSDRILEVDVLAGLYDGAALTLFLVNYLDLSMGTVILQSGQIGEIRLTEGAFYTEFRSLRQHLQQQFIELTGVNCRAVLGDARCTVNLSGQTHTGYDITRTGTVVSVQDVNTLLLSGIVDVTGFYSAGRIGFVTGANAGLQKEIKLHGLVSATGFEVGLRHAFRRRFSYRSYHHHAFHVRHSCRDVDGRVPGDRRQLAAARVRQYHPRHAVCVCAERVRE